MSAALLLEREPELAALEAAVRDATAGTGCVVLISGEAGIGKTSVLRAFVRAVGSDLRVLTGACDDLLTPRTFGPLRDAVAGSAGPLADALESGNRDAVLGAVLEELSGRPTVLVVEDAHWADEATLDVLRFVGRRIADLPVVLAVSYRDDEVGRDHPLQRVLGALAGPDVRRLRLSQLSRTAVARWTGGTSATSADLYRVTEGNPFFVSEVLAAPPGVVPATVVDAVLARVRRLEPAAQRALEQLAVVPTRVELPLARTLLTSLTDLAEAERLGVIEVRHDAVAYRHELARRAVEDSLPVSLRMQLNERVLAALLAQHEPDLTRIVHHAVQAGDDAQVAEHAPVAARRACAAGAQGEGAVLFEQALHRRGLLAAADRAAIAEAFAWALYHTDRRGDAVRAAEEAVQLREGLGDDTATGHAYACLAMQQWLATEPAAALASSERAMQLLAPSGDSEQHASALMYIAMLRMNLDREEAALAPCEDALAMVDRIGVDRLVPGALLCRGRARAQLGDEEGVAEAERGLQLARARGDHEWVLLGYAYLVFVLWRLGRYDEMLRYLDDGAAYGADHDYVMYERTRDAHRYRFMALTGEWDAAERGLRALLDDPDNPGVIGRHVLPTLARLAVRRGREDAGEQLAAARRHAERSDSLRALIPTVIAELEHGVLTGRADAARTAAVRLLPKMAHRERERGELLRYLQRAGQPSAPFDGCPEEYAAGLRGEWEVAARAWKRTGDPYERAWELLDSGDVAATLDALAVFDRLGARPAAALARRRLRELGVRQVPRGPQPTTKANPGGLTDRQLEILRLLGGGLSNAEIAARLVVSVRTVDHHVSAILQKLGVTSRREAAARYCAAVDQ